jgi:hypothetical protein
MVTGERPRVKAHPPRPDIAAKAPSTSWQPGGGYGNIGNGVSSLGIQNCLKVSRFKGSFDIFLNGIMPSRQKFGLFLLNKLFHL